MNDDQSINKSPYSRKILAWVLIVMMAIPLFIFACCLIVVALVAILLMTTKSIGNFWGVIVGNLIFVAGYPIALTAHECGHAAAAYLLGWPLNSIRVGPVVLELNNHSRRIVWIRRINWLSGGVRINILLPVRWKTAFLYAAGPMVNLAGAIVFGLLFAISGSPLVSSVLCSLVAHFVVLGAICFFPMREKGLDSDGLVLLRLLTEPQWNEVPNQNGLR